MYISIHGGPAMYIGRKGLVNLRGVMAPCRHGPCAPVSCRYTCIRIPRVRTNIKLDDKLMAEAQKRTGLPTRKAIVEEGCGP